MKQKYNLVFKKDTHKYFVDGVEKASVWKFKIINEDLIPRKYMMPDSKKIGKIVTDMKNKTDIAGIQAYPDTKMKGART